MCNTILCGETSRVEGFFPHTQQTPHSYYTDATDHTESSVRFFSQQVRNKTLLNLSFNQAKALAVLLYVRMYQREHRCDAQDYTVNKLHEITHLHADTLKKRLSILNVLGLVGCSSRNQIVFLKARAHNPIHNTEIKIPYNATVKQIEKIILAVRIQMKIQQKEYLRNVLSIAQEGFTSNGRYARLDEIKKAKKWLREHCKTDWQRRKFVDYGWSYKSIAKYLGVSIKQAVNVVSFAIKENFLVKHTHSIYKSISSKYELDYFDYTFILGKYAYKVYNNIYTIYTTTTTHTDIDIAGIN